MNVLPFPHGWNTACPDWERRLLAGESLVPRLPLFEDQANKALKNFKRLKLPDVIGTPTLGQAGGEWFFDIVKALFGSYDVTTERRLIQEFFVLVPKKNGKSTYAAALMVTAIIANRRPGAEFTFLAPTIEVAGISFRQARGIIRIDPELSKKFHIQDNIRRITHRQTGAYLQIKAADLDVVTGSKPLGTLIDELHVFSGKPRGPDLLVEIRGALAARPDGFLFTITTQSKDPPAGIFKSELARARDVRDGRLKLPKPLLPVLYELPEKLASDNGWKDERYWPLVNPNLGRSVDIDFLRSSLIDAERKGQTEMALFASQHFNIEIGMALRGDRWAGAEHWQKQADPSLTLAKVIERSEAICIGIDGGGLDDLFGLCALGRCRESKSWLAWTHAWCHEGVLQRRQTIAAKLQDFQNDGDLTIVSDKLDDISSIIKIIADIKEHGKLAGVAVDPAGIGDFIDALRAIAITPENKQVLGAPQGYGMMNAIKTCERRLANGTLWHSGSALMNWAVANVKIEPMATAIRATKQNLGDAKIDPVMAMFDAATMLRDVPETATYEMFFVG